MQRVTGRVDFYSQSRSRNGICFGCCCCSRFVLRAFTLHSRKNPHSFHSSVYGPFGTSGSPSDLRIRSPCHSGIITNKICIWIGWLCAVCVSVVSRSFMDFQRKLQEPFEIICAYRNCECCCCCCRQLQTWQAPFGSISECSLLLPFANLQITHSLFYAVVLSHSFICALATGMAGP